MSSTNTPPHNGQRISRRSRFRLRFPLHQSIRIGLYMMGQKIRNRKRFPMVLMLEPLHKCNLACVGCGRIQEYKDSMKDTMSLEECLSAADECNAPVVSICGGEPLIYDHIVPLTEGLIEQGRYIYLCTNGLVLASMVDRFSPSKRLLFNVHLDGPPAIHDAITCKEGMFDKAVEGIAKATAQGFRVTTNTTFYATTSTDDLDKLFDMLKGYPIEGHTVSPAYAFSEAKEKDEFFLSREDIREKYTGLQDLAKKYTLLASPVYLDFLLGKRELPCAPWANPTRNTQGWRAPCYLLLDKHFPTFREYMEGVDWDSLGPGNDPRCRDCMVHAGFEPSAVTGGSGKFLDFFRILRWQLG